MPFLTSEIERAGRGCPAFSVQNISTRESELAERVGFEPTVGVNLHTLSKRAP